MARKKKITNEQLINALYKCGGIYSHAASQLGISIQAIHYRIKTDDEIAEAYEDACEQMIVLMEDELIKLAKDGHFNAIKFYLKTKGKKRGYTEDWQAEQKATQRQSYYIDGEEIVF